jgi:hypothetical protein
MSATAAQVHRSNAAQRLGKLCRMLRNTLRSYPTARLLHGKGGFGAVLGDGISIYIRWSGHLAPSDLRDLLVLFATWLAVDPARLVDNERDDGDGVSRMANELAYLSNGRLD